MKKLLIIQLDEPYFLFETLQVLETGRSTLKQFDVTILTSEKSLKTLINGSARVSFKTCTNANDLLNYDFDLSINLSLQESSWIIHSQIKSLHKIGPLHKDGALQVLDLWSSHYLTIKGRASFLTFHLRDIFKNIIGIKKIYQSEKKIRNIHLIVFGMPHSNLMTGEELEILMAEIHHHYPDFQIVDVSEVDPIQDLSNVLYIGPATLEALNICGSGAQGLFVSSHFQGFNLLPYSEDHFIVSSKGEKLEGKKLFSIVHTIIKGGGFSSSNYSLYQVVHENLFGAYLKSLNSSDESYPFYQSHVVLWNFLLNLFDTNLEVTTCSQKQIEILKHYKMVLTKLIRLYDYAMSSIDTIHFEAKSLNANAEVINGHLKNLNEIDNISDQISQSHPFLRSILDFYRIRRGQNEGGTLLQQAQHTFLTYSEEHQALKALDELFSVTLNKNEVNI